MFDVMVHAVPGGAFSLSIPFAVSALCVGVAYWRITRAIARDNAAFVEEVERT